MHLGSQYRGSQPFNRLSLSTQVERNAQVGDALKMQLLPSMPLALEWPTSFIQVLGPFTLLKGAYVCGAGSINHGRVKWTTMVTERS
jgi:hypothetical protein